MPSLVSVSEATRAIQSPLLRAIETVVSEEIEKVIEDAKRKVEQRVRGEVGAIAARVLEKFSFERLGQELVIRVEFPGAKSKLPGDL